MRRVFCSLEPGSRIWLSVDGEPILFERMLSGGNANGTPGLKPRGATAARWRSFYTARKGDELPLSFLGELNG